MPKAGLEPACLAAPPPQDGVSANSTTSAIWEGTYLLDFSSGGAGAASFVSPPAGLGAGAASLVSDFCSAGAGAGAGAVAGTTDRLPGSLDMIVNTSDVTMKMIAAAVVAFESSVAAP